MKLPKYMIGKTINDPSEYKDHIWVKCHPPIKYHYYRLCHQDNIRSEGRYIELSTKQICKRCIKQVMKQNLYPALVASALK